MHAAFDRFDEIWAHDFEFTAPPGERPRPICLVAREWRTGREIRLWEDELRTRTHPPYAIGESALSVAYYAPAEMGCHLALDWPMPEHLLDLYPEFRNFTNGRNTPCGSGLLGALTCFGLDAMSVAEKEGMRELAMRGGPYSSGERERLLTYCASDVDALLRLLVHMAAWLDLPRALHRGRYMQTVARMEWNGIPLDGKMLIALRDNWDAIERALIERVDRDFGVYENGHFREARFEEFLIRRGIPWPRLSSGRLRLDDETFREMSHSYPVLKPLRQLRSQQSQMRLRDIALGSDFRNRCMLSPFRSRTGRNQPSNARFIPGAAKWLWGIVRPEPGQGLALIDWGKHEFGVAAALSRDTAMMEAYRSGDPYLAFAKKAGAAPPSATKTSHPHVREEFKAVALAVLYGMTHEGLAWRLRCSPARARQLLDLHRRAYPIFWGWSDAVVDYAMLHGKLWTVFGWTLHVDSNANSRSLRNFPMQANGAEMLRLACCLATEAGVCVCAPIHDAILVEASIEELEGAVRTARSAMAEASKALLNGFELATDVHVVVHPDRLIDKRGEELWNLVMGLLAEIGGDGSGAASDEGGSEL